jgi:hypothetical protein
MKRCVHLWDKAERAGDVLGQILATVNDRLSGNRCRVGFVQDPRRPSVYTVEVAPTNLLAALWWQLGRAVSEHKTFGSCAACGKPFEVAPPVNRKSRHYCSDACRSRAYRSRKEKARRLAGKGRSVKEIAHDLDSTVATVKGWLMPK